MAKKKIKNREQTASDMEQLIQQAKRLESGRRMWIRLSIALLLITVWVIVWYQLSLESLDGQRLFQQSIRLVLLLAGLYLTWIGKLWGKIALALFLLLGALAATLGWLDNPGDWSPKAPLVAMAFIYGFAFYYLMFSNNFKLFFNSLRKSNERDTH